MLAYRIIKYRHSIGGFYSIQQLKEVYGMNDSLFNQLSGSIKVTSQIKRLELNNMDFNELKNHPYIGFQAAKLIAAYNKNHPGAYNDEIISNIPIISEEQKQKLLPYIK